MDLYKFYQPKPAVTTSFLHPLPTLLQLGTEEYSGDSFLVKNFTSCSPFQKFMNLVEYFS